MKLNNLFKIAGLLSVVLLVACSEEGLNKTFENKLYLEVAKKVEVIKVKQSTEKAAKTLVCRVAQPAANDIKIKYAVDASLLDQYNTIYGEEAIMLDEQYYTIPTTTSEIKKGTTDAAPIQIEFHDVNQLNRDNLYLLPVTIKDSEGIEVLESERTIYYVVKGVPTISTVGNLNENYVHIQWNKRDVCNNLSTFTMETLIYANSFPNGHMSSIMGIEAYYLLRIGDAGLQPNQVQLSTGSGNLTTQAFLDTHKWIHLAVTYDNGNVKVYIDGEEAGSGHHDMSDYRGHGVGGAHLAWEDEANFYHKKTGFYIGYACEANRYLDGYFSETRIWNVVRTAEEIKNNFYEVDPKSPGLVSYWKFDEGEGDIVKDHTGNGNDGLAHTPIKWVDVSLPAQEPSPSENAE